MPTKIFLTAATGYIGGTVLDTIANQRPQYEVTVLLRTVPDGFSDRYPKVKIVRGSFDDYDLLADTAAQADIVIHGGKTKHEGSVRAHIAGLLRRSGSSFFIRLGGTGIIADWYGEPYGERNTKIWSDVNDLEEITSLPDWALHRNVEKIIQEVAREHGDKLKCAIISGSGVYGKGRGMVRTQSLYIPCFYAEMKKLGAPFFTGSGTNTRGWVHIDDLMSIYLSLVDDAAAGGTKADWGVQGYYFTASQEATQLEMAKFAGNVLKSRDLIPSDTPKQLPFENIRAMTCGSTWPFNGLYIFASNTRCRADRASTVLGYEPKQPSLWDCMEQDLLACAAPGSGALQSDPST